MVLQAQIDQAKRTVNTDALSFSLNEWIGMYETGEINVNPAFQRLFRWGPEQQSGLIESLLIGVPLPPVFVYENSDGTWELIDGLQRTSSILKFFGKLRKADSDELEPPSVMVGTKYLPDLTNVVWEKSELADIPIEEQVELDQAQKLFLKRCRFNVEVLKQPSDANTKYDLFQRLNRGGSVANQQEIRTCFVVMNDPGFAEKLEEIARAPAFIDMCRISDEGVLQQKNVEYITRLICHTYRELGPREDLNEFLDRAITEILSEEDLASVFARAETVINWVETSYGRDALIPTKEGRKRFSLQGLESVLVGISRNFDAIAQLDNPEAYIRTKISDFWESENSRVITSSGMSASERIKSTVPVGQTFFDPS